jgi:serine protease Do
MNIFETSFERRFSADAGNLAGLLTQAVVEIRSPRGGGAGIIWGGSGLVVTNAHCVPRGAPLRIDSGGRAYNADVIAYSRDHDLALLHAPAVSGPLLELRDVHSLRQGEIVFAHGHPLGVSHSLTMGAIHGVATHPRTGEPRFVVADVRLAPGNSGGALVDAHGRLIGINSMVVGGLGVAVPASVAQEFVMRASSRRAA